MKILKADFVESIDSGHKELKIVSSLSAEYPSLRGVSFDMEMGDGFLLVTPIDRGSHLKSYLVPITNVKKLVAADPPPVAPVVKK